MERKARILSARPTQRNQVRPVSAATQQLLENFDKTYFEQGYEPVKEKRVGIINNRRFSAKTKTEKVYKGSSNEINKREQMMQELMKSKQTVNKLVQELTRQRQKSEMMRKKSIGYSKMLGAQFQNQQHWQNLAVNNHLVAGIKAMYFKLKQKYQYLSQEHEATLKTLSKTDLLQKQQEINILLKQNKRLSLILEEVRRLSKGTELISQTNKQAQTYIIVELENENKNLEDKIKLMEMKYAQLKQHFNKADIQIQFQKKLVIQKQNERHSTNLKNKRLIKENNQLKAQIKDFVEQKTRLQAEFQLLKKNSAKREFALEEKCKQKIERSVLEKDKRIEFLEKNNFEFQEVISELRRKKVQLESLILDLQEKRKKVKHRQETQIQERVKTVNTWEVEKVHEDKDYGNIYSGKRVQRRADKRHSQDAKKRRKVKQSQVEGIAELIKYKMIAQHISLEELKDKFNFQDDSQLQNDDEEEQQWAEQYLNMKEVTQILKSSPLDLSEENSLTLARYLIEDASEDHVYCDFLNENKREIVKSIIKTLVGSYNVEKGNEIQNEMKKIIDQYGSNLFNTLTILEPSGFVSKIKFQGILKSLGIQVSDKSLELLLGKMALKANNISKLPYKVLF